VTQSSPFGTRNKVLALVLLLFVASCAPTKGKPVRAKIPPNSRTPPVSSQLQEEELTPQRAASNALVDDGEKVFNLGLYDRAADLFQEAVTVDSSNGAGYYHLALTKLRAGEYGEAEGLVEKAELLLGNQPDWTDRLEDLRRELSQKKP
jgi:tetratricopeptide (TPR) repeat protein